MTGAGGGAPNDPQVACELALRRALPWRIWLDYLRPRLIAGPEAVDGDVYLRRVGASTIRVAADGPRVARRLRLVGVADPGDAAASRVARLFAADEDPRPAAQALARCPDLRPRIGRVPGLRPLGCWDGFELCVRTVIGQQVSVAAAATLTQRLVQRCGGSLTPSGVLDADLARIGMPGRRVATLRGLARAVVDGNLRLENAGWNEVDRVLRELPGFGPWTRAYLAIRLGRDPDAFPHGDVGLIRAAGCHSPAGLLRRAEAWRPYRALAATYLWTV